MPTERFERLPEEKQLAIRDAAIKEFIRVPFEKASINQIIQNADISRGSFYTYFEDKRDLLRYIFKDSKKRTQDFCLESLKNNHGDMWVMLEELVDFSFECNKGLDIFRLSQHVMLYAETENLLEEAYCSHIDGKLEKIEEWLYQNVDKSEMRGLSQENFHNLVDMCAAAYMTSIVQYYKKQKTREEVQSAFAWKISVLKRGICR